MRSRLWMGLPIVALVGVAVWIGLRAVERIVIEF